MTEKDWYFEAAAEGKRRGIVKGSSGGKYLRPNDPVNLAEILRMIFVSEGIRTELSEAPLPPDVPEGAWYAKDVAHAVSIGMASQQEDGRIFPPSSTLNRGQLSLLLYRFLQSRNNVSFGYAMTAAHKTLPFGTIVRATNMNSGKSVLVVINDRGPFVTGRIIDLSKSAFSAIENPGTGVVSVQLEVVESP
ncbi:septal ring lytic transglycosylase RlpA family protein [Candidatus Peregrinibacteria bacterium]|nr:septal ring lytic transglycosylase RlpA family protein [Candidatus Peregrinibacteria bacterium]